MATFKFAKLVRDNIIDQQIDNGSKPLYRVLNTTEHKQALIEKINEEAREIIDAPADELAKEIADVQQALDDLRDLCKVTREAVTNAQQTKNEKAGPFKKGIYLESVEAGPNDPWVEYYRQNPDRYPEIKA